MQASILRAAVVLAALVLTGTIQAATPPESPRSRMQAEQGGKQAFANRLLAYLAGEPARRKALGEASDHLLAQAFASGPTSEKMPDAGAIGLPAWKDSLATLKHRDLSPVATTRLLAVEAAIGESIRLLGLIPPPAPSGAKPQASIERQRALMVAVSSLGTLGQRAGELNAQIQEDAGRAGSDARQLADRLLLLPESPKGEKP